MPVTNDARAVPARLASSGSSTEWSGSTACPTAGPRSPARSPPQPRRRARPRSHRRWRRARPSGVVRDERGRVLHLAGQAGHEHGDVPGGGHVADRDRGGHPPAAGAEGEQPTSAIRSSAAAARRSLEGSSPLCRTSHTRRMSVTGPCAWCSRRVISTRPSTRRSSRSRPSSASVRRETLRNWVRQDQIDAGPASGHDDGGVRPAQGAEEGERRAQAGQRDPQGRGEFLRGRARPATHTLVAFIDEHRDRFGGVEPICRVAHRARLQDRPLHLLRPPQTPRTPSARTVRDAELKELISEVYDANYRVYGARKIWRELNRQGHRVARCTVERLMRELGITGAVRGKKVITTIPGRAGRAGPGPRGPRLRRRRPEPLLGRGLHLCSGLPGPGAT